MYKIWNYIDRAKVEIKAFFQPHQPRHYGMTTNTIQIGAKVNRLG